MAHPWTTQVEAINATPREAIPPDSSTRTVRSPDGKHSWTGVSTSPVQLHKFSGLDRNTYALARCISSESGGSGEALLAIAECVRNEAAAREIEIYNLLTNQTSPEYSFTRWQYGEQRGRYASTRQQPNRRALAAARFAIAGSTGIADGGRRWAGLRTMDGGTQGGKPLSTDAVGLVEKWGAEGWRWIGPLPNVDTYRELCVFRRLKEKQSNSDLISVIESARNGAPMVGTESPDRATAAVARDNTLGWLLAAGLVGAVA